MILRLLDRYYNRCKAGSIMSFEDLAALWEAYEPRRAEKTHGNYHR